jgi:anti-anti-sigma regulatory factor
MSAVAYIDNTGIEALAALWATARQDHGQLCIANPSAKIIPMINEKCLGALINISPTINAAIRSFS